VGKLKIYLAGPDVFRLNAIEYFDILKKSCIEFGFEALVPLDNSVEINEEDIMTPVHSKLIFNENFNLIKECDVIVANLVPFRGACIDDGTAWEIGCGFAFGKKIYGYSKYNEKSLLDITEEFGYKMSEFPIVENFGNSVNLMICESIKKSGGFILEKFEDCLKHLSEYEGS